MESHILPGFCGCPTIMVSTYYFQIHAGCIHGQTYDEVSPEDLNSHPQPHPHPHTSHHHHHTIHIGTAGNYNHHLHHHNDPDHHHHPHHQQHHQQQEKQNQQSSVGVGGGDNKDSDNNKHHHHSNMGIISFHNSTLNCEKNNHGETYWVSFHEKSFYRGQHFKLYKGLINGRGPLSGIKCVVKVFANTIGTKELCNMETCKSEKFRELVRAFNKKLGVDSPHRLRATRSYWAPIDEVSKLKQLFFSGDKKLQMGEAVLFEQDIRVSDFSTKKCKMHTFVDQSGRTCSDHHSTSSSSAYSSVVNAFVHFTHHHSNGSLIVCGLNGIKDEEGFFFSTPVIHSANSAFGKMDRGERGIQEVIKNHTCGKLCEEFFGTTNFNIPPATTSSAVRSQNIDIVGDSKRHGCSGIVNGDELDGRPLVSPGTGSPDQKNSNNNLMATSPCSIESVGSWLDDACLQPSAPTMDGEEMDPNGNDPLPAPPPYTPTQEARVALWIIGEESQNTFLHLSQSGTLQPCGSVAMGTSVECHSSHTVRTETNAVTGSVDSPGVAAMQAPPSCGDSASVTTAPTVFPAFTEPSPDVNANFSCHTTTNRTDDYKNSSRVNHADTQYTNGNIDTNPTNGEAAAEIPQPDLSSAGASSPPTPPRNNESPANRAAPNKQVRFAPQPSYRPRAWSSSVPTTSPSMADDITMESYTNPTASVSSGSPSLAARFGSRHLQDAANNNRNSCIPPNQNNITNNDNNNNNMNNVVGPNPLAPNAATDDQPPPYDEHDIATANWLLNGRGGLDMYSHHPPVIIQAGQLIRQVSYPGMNYFNNNNNNNNDNNNNENSRNGAGNVFVALPHTDLDSWNRRFF